MKKNVLFILATTFYILSTVLSGCATVKEMGKGFIGVSTQVLDQKRKDALKKSFALDYDSCYLKTKEILSQKHKEAYIYAQDYKEKFIAIYLSLTDTTCVGIFFTEEAGSHTLIEISSPSTYAKEEIANRIFTGMDELVKPKIEEQKINVKEKSGN
jgi:predicted small secreted protein